MRLTAGKRIALGGLLGLLSVAASVPLAHAGPWCVYYDAYTYNCGFQTFAQCLATSSGDPHAVCSPNHREPSPPPAQERRSRVR